MKFTPTSFLSGQLGPTLIATTEGGTSGSFTSGGIDYGFIKFTTGSYTLNVSTGTDVSMLVVGGGGGGELTPDSQVGGGGGGVFYTDTRLYRGTYNIIVGAGGNSDNNGQSSSITAYGYLYEAGGGFKAGTSGFPQSNAPGSNSGNCGGTGVNRGGGGGGGAAATGSSAICPGGRANGANGGQGLTYNMDGVASVYGSGGGGGSATGAFAQGGLGGTNAGNGASYNTDATNAINGFGGGGGGERAGNTGQSGKGGHGVVVIKYRL
jgi:hypothetical protein